MGNHVSVQPEQNRKLGYQQGLSSAICEAAEVCCQVRGRHMEKAAAHTQCEQTCAIMAAPSHDSIQEKALLQAEGNGAGSRRAIPVERLGNPMQSR